MIESGWILPNGKEYLCGISNAKTNYGNRLHFQVVKKYLEVIKISNPVLSEILTGKLSSYTFPDGFIDFETFALCVLGWIKVGNYDNEKYLNSCYANFQFDTIRKYMYLGYTEMHIDTTDFYLIQQEIEINI